MNKKRLHIDYTNNFIDFTVKYLADYLKKIELNQPVINIALSGGSTPLPILNRLKNEDLSWEKYNFFIVDERIVDLGSKDSNYNNINSTFFSYLPSKNFSMLKGTEDSEKNGEAYEKLIKTNVANNKEGVPAFDLILLGMGDDGHTASLFPNTSALLENKKLVTVNHVPQQKNNRITLTYPILENAKKGIVLINGASKQSVLNEIIYNKPVHYPIYRLIESQLNLSWIIGIN